MHSMRHERANIGRARDAHHGDNRQVTEQLPSWPTTPPRSEEHTSELQSPCNLVCRLLLEKKKNQCATPFHCSMSGAAFSGTATWFPNDRDCHYIPSHRDYVSPVIALCRQLCPQSPRAASD